jgi:hypothetical protein
LYQYAYTTWEGVGGNPADFGHAGPYEQHTVFLRTPHSAWYGDGC